MTDKQLEKFLIATSTKLKLLVNNQQEFPRDLAEFCRDVRASLGRGMAMLDAYEVQELLAHEPGRSL